MGKWKMVRLGDVTTINMGQSPSSETYNNIGDGLPFFQGKADFGLIHPTVRMYCSEPKKIAENNSILLSVRAPVGAVNIATQTCCIGRGLAAISEIKNVSHYRYLFYFLKYKESDIANMGVGSTFKAISRKDFDAIQLPLPPMDVQKKIADVLDKASALIELRRAQLGKLDLLIKSQFIEMFGDPATNIKRWPIVLLKDLFNVRSSKRIYQGEQTTQGVPFLRVSDLVQKINGSEASCNLYISNEQYNDFLRSGLVPDSQDILVTTRGTIGKCYIIQPNDRFYFQDGMISWLEKNDVKVESVYISYFFEMDSLKRQVAVVSKGATVDFLSLDKLGQLKVMYPDYKLQKQFSAFVQQVDQSKFEIQQSLSQLELNYKSLMQKCFRGELF